MRTRLIRSCGKGNALPLFLWALLFINQKISAQQDEMTEKLAQELEELKQEVKQLKERPSGVVWKEILEKLHFFGYGEVHYNNPRGTGLSHKAGSEVDVHRLVIGTEVNFAEGIRYDMELDFEHGFGDPEVEYAHLNFDLTKDLTFRVGSLLMPVGPLNEFHEPPLFYSVERPRLDNFLIPTTWQEVGFGFVGRQAAGKLGYRLYLVNGLRGSQFRASDGIRRGRGRGRQASSDDIAVVGRVEYKLTPQLDLGTSAYTGGADQDERGDFDGAGPAPSQELEDIQVTLYEADAKYRTGDLEVKGVFTWTNISNADDLSAATGQRIGKHLAGWYGEADYHLKSWLFADDSDQDAVLFVRREAISTNHEMPSGVNQDETGYRQIWTVGAAYYPIPQIVFKADFERWKDGADDKVGRLNLGVGFMF